MKYRLFFLSILLVPVFLSAQNESTDLKLKQVIEDFRTSIIAHDDIEKFGNLFLHDSITWGRYFYQQNKKGSNGTDAGLQVPFNGLQDILHKPKREKRRKVLPC